MLSLVSLVRGESRRSAVAEALDRLPDGWLLRASQAEHVVVKPNFTSATRQLAATHVEAVEAVLERIGPVARRLTLAEGPGVGRLEDALENFGYRSLIKRFGLTVMDIHRDETRELAIATPDGRGLRAAVSRTMLESDCRISVCPLKTHDFVGVTLSVKNVVMGSVVGARQREELHTSALTIHEVLAGLARRLAPHLGVIDGWIGMEGEGPSDGDPVDMGIAIASSNPFAADRLGAQVMGFDLARIPYLDRLVPEEFASAVEGPVEGPVDGSVEARVEVVGNVGVRDVVRPFRPHPSFPAA